MEQAMSTLTAETAKVMPKGQITLPISIRKALGLDTGDTVTMLQQGNKVVMMNAAEYAMRIFQEAMVGQAEAAGWSSDTEVSEMITEMRRDKGA
jgi:AbrB family looped-hinge helix DNA binding protein